jgi:5'-3' exonuclease
MDPATASAISAGVGAVADAYSATQQRMAQEAMANAQVEIEKINRDVSLDTNAKALKIKQIDADLASKGLATQVTLADKGYKLEIAKQDYKLLQIRTKSTANTQLINQIIKGTMVLGIVVIIIFMVLKKES